MIRIDVVRDDGEITRLRGESGMAACMGPLDQRIEASDPATVSLRCSTPAEMAWNLATLMAAVRHNSPEAFELAGLLMEYCNYDRPVINRRLPPRPEGGDG